ARFHKTIYDHYQAHRRPFPWRDTPDPYHIFISEIMLQQTQADRVVPKYLAFTEQFRDFPSLAMAPLAQVLTAWQGLGYNRRALMLHRAAQIVVSQHGGKLPQTVEELDALHG